MNGYCTFEMKKFAIKSINSSWFITRHLFGICLLYSNGASSIVKHVKIKIFALPQTQTEVEVFTCSCNFWALRLARLNEESAFRFNYLTAPNGLFRSIRQRNVIDQHTKLQMRFRNRLLQRLRPRWDVLYCIIFKIHVQKNKTTDKFR